MEKYENQCGSCYWLRDMNNDNTMFCGSSNEKGHCIYLKNCYYPDDKICSYYKEKSYNPGGGCYITTIVCDILGYDDKSPVLETLRSFRTNIMQQDPKYAPILHEYDTVGPQIANCLRQEEPGLVSMIFEKYIGPTAKLINDNKHNEAVNKYKEMTKSLEDYYGIRYDGIVPSDYDYTKGGHGYMKKLGEYHG